MDLNYQKLPMNQCHHNMKSLHHLSITFHHRAFYPEAHSKHQLFSHVLPPHSIHKASFKTLLLFFAQKQKFQLIVCLADAQNCLQHQIRFALGGWEVALVQKAVRSVGCNGDAEWYAGLLSASRSALVSIDEGLREIAEPQGANLFVFTTTNRNVCLCVVKNVAGC